MENEELRKKQREFNHYQVQERHVQDKVKQIQLVLVDSEKKNDLLRVDLETMRNKTSELIMINKKLEQEKEEN